MDEILFESSETWSFAECVQDFLKLGHLALIF